MSAARNTSRRNRPAEQAAAEQAQPEKKLTVFERVAEALDSRRGQIIALYGGDERIADRMRMVALHALADPKLASKLEQADFATVVEALRESAALGLMPVSSTAEGYLVPRRNSAKSQAAGRTVYDVTFLPGWRGLLKLTLRSRLVASIDTEVVYEGDQFEHEKGTTPRLRHVRALTGRGNPIATYAVAYMVSGPPIFEIVDEAEMAMIMKSSSSRDYDSGSLIGPWVEWPDEMRRKSALRRLDKRLPLDLVAERALQYEAETDERYAGRVSVSDPRREALPIEASAAQRARAAFVDEPRALPSGDGEPEPPKNGSGQPGGSETHEAAPTDGAGQGGPESAGAGDDPRSAEEAECGARTRHNGQDVVCQRPPHDGATMHGGRVMTPLGPGLHEWG